MHMKFVYFVHKYFVYHLLCMCVCLIIVYFMYNHVMLWLFMVCEICILKFVISVRKKLNCSPLVSFKANMQKNAPQSYLFSCCGVFSLLPSRFHSSMFGSFLCYWVLSMHISQTGTRCLICYSHHSHRNQNILFFCPERILLLLPSGYFLD